MRTKQIDIKEPIWKDRSVGVNISDVTPETMIEVAISYVTKDNRRIYPYFYRMMANEVYKYPVKKVRGVMVHIVPIEDFLAYNSSIVPKEDNILPAFNSIPSEEEKTMTVKSKTKVKSKLITIDLFNQP